MGFSKPKGPSAAELKAQQEQADRLRKQEEEAKLAAERESELTAKQQAASRRRQTGRGSLIATSELGAESTLG